MEKQKTVKLKNLGRGDVCLCTKNGIDCPVIEAGQVAEVSEEIFNLNFADAKYLKASKLEIVEEPKAAALPKYDPKAR